MDGNKSNYYGINTNKSLIHLKKMKKQNFFIVIPAYNEAKHVSEVLKKIKKEGYKNVVFVDDGSTDGTASIARKQGVVVLEHIINLGKGAATKTGCDYAVKNKAELIVLIDSDGQHKPEDIKRLIDTLKKTDSDIVFGFRPINKNMPFVMKFGNWFINNATKIVEGVNLKDTQSGFRCFTTYAYKKIRWKSADYSMESEMISNVARNKLKYTQIKIQTIYLDNFKGTSIFDGIKIFINILRFRIFGG